MHPSCGHDALAPERTDKQRVDGSQTSLPIVVSACKRHKSGLQFLRDFSILIIPGAGLGSNRESS